MTTATDAVAAMGAILQAIGAGDLGAEKAGKLAKVVAGFAQRVARIERSEIRVRRHR